MAWLDDIQVAGDDGRPAELGEEAGQRRGHGVLEGAFVLVAPLLGAAGGHVQAEQSDVVAAERPLLRRGRGAGARRCRWGSG